MRGKVILPALPARSVEGSPLVLLEPISFWGGVDATTGTIIDGQSSRYGSSLAHRVLAIREMRGSSSTSAVLLELIYRDLAPAAILLIDIDAILVLGAITGREMGWSTPPILQISEADLANLPENSIAEIDVEGHIKLRGSSQLRD